MKRLAVILLLLPGALAAGCRSERPPANLIEEDTYIDLLVEFKLLASFQQVVQLDSAYMDSMRGTIFNQYKVTREQFETSHAYFQKQVETHEQQLKEALERLKKESVRDKVEEQQKSRIQKEREQREREKEEARRQLERDLNRQSELERNSPGFR